MQRRDLLRDVEDPAAVAQAPLACARRTSKLLRRVISFIVLPSISTRSIWPKNIARTGRPSAAAV